MAELNEKITDETEVSTTELATVIGVTARRVQQLAQDGTLPTVRRGRFLLADSVQRFFRLSSSAQTSKDKAALELEREKSEVQIRAAKAVVADLEAKELRGHMHRAEDVEAITEDLVYTMRDALMALPGRLAVDVSACETAAEASEVIRKEVHAVLRELAAYHYDPKKYADRVRARRAWEGEEDDDQS